MVLYTGNKLIEVNITADIYVFLYQQGCMYVCMQRWSVNYHINFQLNRNNFINCANNMHDKKYWKCLKMYLLVTQKL